MSVKLHRKRDIRNSQFREEATRTPNYKQRSLKLHKHQVNKEELISLAEQFNSPDCSIEKLEIMHTAIDLTLAEKFKDAISVQKCSLKQITFENCRFKFEAMRTVMQAIKSNRSIKALRIRSVVFHEKEASLIGEMLAGNQILNELTLTCCGIDDAGMIQIASGLVTCNNIKYLDLRCNNFEVQGLHSLIESLQQTCSCRTLMLEDIQIDEEQAIYSLKKLLDDSRCQIQVLELNSLDMNENTGLKLINSLKNLRKLKHLSLKKNTFTASFLETLAREIQNLRSLTILNLSHCSITDDDFEVFCENLTDSNVLELDISWNELSTLACADLRKLLENNSNIQVLLLQHNSLGGYCFSQLANAINSHQAIRYLDVSWNKISNSGFKQIFYPISRNKTKLEHLECRGNGLGGKDLDNVLSCVSHSLKILDLSKNNLNEINGQMLKGYAEKNVWIEIISVDGNDKIKIEDTASIKHHCLHNIQIKHFILPRLSPASETGFKHKSLANNCYQEFDVRELTFQNCSYFRLAFVAKFMVENKESFEKLVLKDVHIEGGGEELAETLKGKAGDMDLKVLHLENVNLSLLGLRQIIHSCGNMQNLKELSLINMEKVKQDRIQQMLFKAFKTHKHLELLDLRQNKLNNFDTIVQIMENNRHIQRINVRGSPMSVDNLGYMWLGLRENTSVMELEYQRERVAFAFSTLQAVEIDLVLNQEINATILPIVEKQNEKRLSALDLTGVKIYNMESILKYTRIHKSINALNLSNTSIEGQDITKLVNALVSREIQLNRLNLSKNTKIDDKICTTLGHLFKQRSTIKHLILDETSITEDGLRIIIESIVENLKVHTLSFRKCKVYITDPIYSPQWNIIKNVLKQNCSLTLLDLNDNDNNIDEEFLKEISVDIEKNKKIVENIFPKLLEQEDKAEKKQKQKAEKPKKGKFIQVSDVDPLRSKGKESKTKQKRRASFDAGQLLQRMPTNVHVLNLASPKGHHKKLSSRGSVNPTVGRRESRMININRETVGTGTIVNDLATIAEEAKQKDDRKSVQEEYNDSLDNEISESGSEQQSESKSQMSAALSVQEDEDGFNLELGDMNFKDLSFLTKFMTQFKKIKNIDIGESKLKQKELGELTKAVQQNPYIQEIKLNGSMSKRAKALMKAELEKNKAIQAYGGTGLDPQDNSQHELNLASQGSQGINVQAVSKMIKFKAQLQDLNLSGNKLGNHGARDVALMIEENSTIQRLKLKDCGIGSQGLQVIVSALCTEGNENLEALDIRGNHVPDKHLKMLLVLMYKNRNIQEIQYSLIDPENEARKLEYIEMIEKEHIDAVRASQRILGHAHHEHYSWWHYALFFPWVWKSFVHAKHEAFAFKYDPEIMRLLEEKEMQPIRVMMYFWSVIYYIILFALPFVFRVNYCGGLFYDGLYWTYGAYAILNAGWEMYIVLRIQNEIRQKVRFKSQAKKLLDFNRWHVVELFMGQIARLDTFLDFLFIVIVMQCEELRGWLFISSFYMIANFIYPTFMLLKKLKMPTSHLQHTMPYMEANNFLSFLRENMLLATVVDSFCINNTKSFFKKWRNGKGVHVTFGRLMGTLTFFLQDFPQFTLHACFKIYPYLFAYPAVHYHLKGQQLLLISMFVSGAAVMISCFNMIMCVENEFDPVLLETALQKRRAEVAQRKEEAQRELDQFKRQKTTRDTQKGKEALKNAFLASLLKYAETEEQKASLLQKKESVEQRLAESKRISVESSIVKRFQQFNQRKSNYFTKDLNKGAERKVDLIPIADEKPKMTDFQHMKTFKSTFNQKSSESSSRLNFKQSSLKKKGTNHENSSHRSQNSDRSRRSSKRSVQFLDSQESQMKFKSGPAVVLSDNMNSPQLGSQTQIIPWNSGSSQELNQQVTRNDFHGMNLDSHQNSFVGGYQQKEMLILNQSHDQLLNKNEEEHKNSMSFLPSITDRKVATFKFGNILAGTDPDSISDGGSEQGQPSNEAEEYYTGKGTGKGTGKIQFNKSFDEDFEQPEQIPPQHPAAKTKPASPTSNDSQFRYKMRSGKVNIVSPM